MAFPLLFPLLASGGALLRASPHIFRFFAPKVVTGANRLGQLITKSPVGKFVTKNPKFSALMAGGTAIESMMTPETAHSPNNPYLQLQQKQFPFYTVPGVEMPPGFGKHPPMPDAMEEDVENFKPKVDVPQTQPFTAEFQTPPREPTDVEKFLQSNTYKFFQSDAYQKLKDLFAGMAASSSDGSGWDALASGVKHLNEGDKQRGQVNQTVEYLKSKGYSEEEARFMARNPQMLSAMLTGGDTPKLPLGYQWYTNPETGEREVRPLKGSLLELEYNQKKRDIEEWEIGKRNTSAVVAKEINNIVDTVNNALQIIEKNPKKAAGKVGAFAQIFPDTAAKTLKNKLKTLEGGVFVRVIEAIKKQSDGGRLGVGPLSNEESRRIVASYGTMDISDKPEELYKTLLKIKDMFDLFKKLNDEEIYRLSNGMEVRSRLKYSAQDANQSMSQGGSANLPTISSREDIKKLSIGERVSIQDGNYIYDIIRDR
ncbi:hypothetical protein [Bartonella rattimassiliensis]|uniref:hypothetical protein n=1 Tax=Bartonella rattimassiliensis TaxID=270250 RepID=UPI000376F196|nr:hypothetical protein [Bartonella rattimassiliensis]